jgi:hypothetical protein
LHIHQHGGKEITKNKHVGSCSSFSTIYDASWCDDAGVLFPRVTEDGRWRMEDVEVNIDVRILLEY